uniref:Uncharacterized protein n=1 Tax=Chinchilla lanigera TaxID=34839 RepID=A0A8C2V2P3_CHILA
SQKRDIGYFNHLKADSRNVTNGMTFSTKSSNQDFIKTKLIGNTHLNKVQAPIIRDKSCDFLAILDQLDPDALPDGRIWLFGFNPSETLQQSSELHDPLGVRGASEGVGLQRCAQMRLLVLLVVPLLVPPVAAELPGSTQTATLA